VPFAEVAPQVGIAGALAGAVGWAGRWGHSPALETRWQTAGNMVMPMPVSA
jgi:hypothetical protein